LFFKGFCVWSSFPLLVPTSNPPCTMSGFGSRLGHKFWKGAVSASNYKGRIRLRWRYLGARYSLSLSCLGQGVIGFRWSKSKRKAVQQTGRLFCFICTSKRARTIIFMKRCHLLRWRRVKFCSYFIPCYIAALTN